jgi:hypothetical protein
VNETDVANLIVRLTGDVDSFTKGMKDAVDASNRASKAVEENTKKIEDMSKGLNEYAKGAVESLAALGEFKWLEGAVEKAEEMKVGMEKLKASIELNGGEVEETARQYLKFADAMTKATLASKGETATLLRHIEVLGLTGKEAEKAAKLAIGLGGATESSAESMTRVAVEIQRGDYTMARRVLRLRDVKDETELVDQINKRVAQGFSNLKIDMESSSGQLTLLQRNLSYVRKEVGLLVLEPYEKLIAVVKGAVEAHKELPGWVKAATLTVLASGVAATTALLSYKAFVALGLMPYIAMAGRALAATLALNAASVGAAIGAALAASWAAATSALKFFTTASATAEGALLRQRALMLAAAAAAVYMAYEIYKANKNVEEYAAAVDKSSETAGKLLGVQAKLNQSKIASIDANAVFPEDKIRAFTAEIAKADEAVSGYQKSIEKWKNEQEELLFPNTFENSTFKQMAENIRDAEKGIERARETAKTFRGELDKLNPVKAKLHDVGELKVWMKEQQKEVDLIGKTAAEVKAYELSLKRLSQAEVDAAVSMVRVNEALKYRQTLVQSNTKLAADWMKAIEEAGLTEDQKKIKELADQGIDAVNRGSTAILKMLANAKDAAEMRAELNKTSTEMSRLVDPTLRAADGLKLFYMAQHGAAEEVVKGLALLARQSKALEDAGKLNDQYQSPQQKYKDTLDHLNAALYTGVLRYDAYVKAVGAARDELDKLNDGALGITGTLKNSAEGMAKLLDYRERLHRQTNASLDLLPPNARGTLQRPGFNGAGGFEVLPPPHPKVNLRPFTKEVPDQRTELDAVLDRRAAEQVELLREIRDALRSGKPGGVGKTRIGAAAAFISPLGLNSIKAK